MPKYVEHREGATEIGKLTAEAIVGEYETAAREIEGMGSQLIDCVKRCEALTWGCLFVIEEMKETAARYREEAKRVFLQIENCMLMTAEVRICSGIQRKRSPSPYHDMICLSLLVGPGLFEVRLGRDLRIPQDVLEDRSLLDQQKDVV